jgi:hypothetical protein
MNNYDVLNNTYKNIAKKCFNNDIILFNDTESKDTQFNNMLYQLSETKDNILVYSYSITKADIEIYTSNNRSIYLSDEKILKSCKGYYKIPRDADFLVGFNKSLNDFTYSLYFCCENTDIQKCTINSFNYAHKNKFIVPTSLAMFDFYILFFESIPDRFNIINSFVNSRSEFIKTGHLLDLNDEIHVALNFSFFPIKSLKKSPNTYKPERMYYDPPRVCDLPKIPDMTNFENVIKQELCIEKQNIFLEKLMQKSCHPSRFENI